MNGPHPSLVVVVPVYRPVLQGWEAYGFVRSMPHLQGRTVEFIAPSGMDLSWYLQHCPHASMRHFERAYFGSIQGYNRLLLDPDFYRTYANYTFMLVLQTDAWLLHGDIDPWLHRPYDYIGAPWPQGLELLIQAGPFEGNNGRRVRAMVGNGGFSLRRIYPCAALLEEFAVPRQVFLQSGSSEDLFFAFLGQLSADFVLPNEIVASRFALELEPRLYHRIHQGALPLGTHAWWKHDLPFWREQFALPDVEPTSAVA